MKKRENQNNITSLKAGFFSSKEKVLNMTIEKEKAPQPWTVTELNKTDALHCNSLIKLGKSISRHTQTTCCALLTSGLDNIITTLITIAAGLLTAYSMGGL